MKPKVELDLSLSDSIKQYYNLRGLVSESLLLSIIEDNFDKETRLKSRSEIIKDKIPKDEE